jgi:hypothetical protein
LLNAFLFPWAQTKRQQINPRKSQKELRKQFDAFFKNRSFASNMTVASASRQIFVKKKRPKLWQPE